MIIYLIPIIIYTNMDKQKLVLCGSSKVVFGVTLLTKIPGILQYMHNTTTSSFLPILPILSLNTSPCVYHNQTLMRSNTREAAAQHTLLTIWRSSEWNVRVMSFSSLSGELWGGCALGLGSLGSRSAWWWVCDLNPLGKEPRRWDWISLKCWICASAESQNEHNASREAVQYELQYIRYFVYIWS